MRVSDVVCNVPDHQLRLVLITQLQLNRVHLSNIRMAIIGLTARGVSCLSAVLRVTVDVLDQDGLQIRGEKMLC